MEVPKTPLLWSLSAIFGLWSIGCSLSQQPKLRTPFLPPPSLPAAAGVGISEPPAIQAGLLLHETPAILNHTVLPALRTRADGLLQRAEQRLQRGRKLYQANDTENARKEFDTAIDLMLQASDHNPIDRQVYERKMDQMVEAIHRFDLSGLGAAASLEEARFEKAPYEDLLQMTFPVDPRMKDRVREQVAATVSQLPLSVTDAVLGYIQYFSSRGHRTIINALQRGGRYRPMIRRILDEEGVPQELIHLAQAESGFYPRARSRMAAVGMWQFVSFRGKEYGLNQTPMADERMDPEKSTRAAARHLRDLYTRFGDWYLAIAAYNCGPGVVEKAVERTGYADFWELRNRRVLPAETTNYVPIILAMTIMEKNAAEYGLTNITPEPAEEYDTIEIAAPTHLALIADLTETPVAQLMELNPALLRPTAPEGYSLHVPKGLGGALMASLQLVPPDRRKAWRMHKVGFGETIASIGKRYNTAPASIVAANTPAAAQMQEGDRLLIPAAYQEPRSTQRKPAATRSRTRRSPTRASSAGPNSPKARSTPAASKAPPAKKQPKAITQRASR